MTVNIDLIILGSNPKNTTWPLGAISYCDASIQSLNGKIKQLVVNNPNGYVLIWEAKLGFPNTKVIKEIINSPGDVWHAGLLLGTKQSPPILDFVANNWMLLCDPTDNIPATSWRLSLRCCLARNSVFSFGGEINSNYQSMDGAALEYGYQLLQRGVILRSCPNLMTSTSFSHPITLSIADQFLFIRRCFGKKWTYYTAMRWTMVQLNMVFPVFKALRNALKSSPNPLLDRYTSISKLESKKNSYPTVSIIIPTIDRYPYLKNLLQQLRDTTVPPLEIIIADQTSAISRQPELYEQFSDLPLNVIYLDKPGQCSSRNKAIQQSKGDFILLLDDDISVQPRFIQEHLDVIQRYQADVSCGTFDENGRGPLPPHFTLAKISDVFPSCNGMVSRLALQKSGIFDIAFEKGARADLDLGIRLYLSGALLMINPINSIYHFHAVSGGLRVHKSRKMTYARARKSLLRIRIPSATEWYLNKRYFSKRQQREFFFLSVMVLLTMNSSLIKKIMKVILFSILLPLQIIRLKHQEYLGKKLAKNNPNIPTL